MKRIASSVFVISLAIAALAFSVVAGQRSAASAQISDAVVDGLKFHPIGGFIQVVDVAKSESAGTIILPPNQPPVFAPMPGYDARIRAAYEKYSHGGSEAAPPSAPVAATTPTDAPAAASTPANAPSPAFDPPSKTVTWSDGRSVRFVDDENLKVEMGGPAGTKIYDLHYHGSSPYGAVKGWASREQGRVGGSVGGSGVTMSLEGQNGMPGGDVYDTANGIHFGNSGLAQAKSITTEVRDAISIVKGSAQPTLAESKIIKSLLSNNLGI